MKIELDLKTGLGLLGAIGMIVGATITIYTTFATKAELEKLESRFNQHIHYHMAQTGGVKPEFSGPIAPITPDDGEVE